MMSRPMMCSNAYQPTPQEDPTLTGLMLQPEAPPEEISPAIPVQTPGLVGTTGGSDAMSHEMPVFNCPEVLRTDDLPHVYTEASSHIVSCNNFAASIATRCAFSVRSMVNKVVAEAKDLSMSHREKYSPAITQINEQLLSRQVFFLHQAG